MDAEQMDLLERLARLRELGAISRSEFRREKEAIFRAPPRPLPVQLRALPSPGQAGPGAVPAIPLPGPVAPRPRVARPPEPDRTLLERTGLLAGWGLWTLFSIGGLDALLDHDPLQALSLLVAGLFFAPPLHRLLALHLALPTRLLITLLGAIAALGIGSANSAAVQPAAAGSAAACQEAVSEVVESRGERARDGIARPWRKVWTDLLWARVAGRSAYEEWRSGGRS